MRVVLTLLLMLPTLLFGQKVSDWEELGDEAFDQGNYAKAALAYEEAMLLDSSLFNLTVKYAESLRLSRDYGRALHYYDKIYGKDRGKLFREGQFWLASMQKLQGDYKEALRNFKKYKTRVKREQDSYWYKKTVQEMEACTFAIKARRDSGTLVIEHLPDGINTSNADFGAQLYMDSVLYFSSNREGKSSLYFTLIQDSVYSSPTRLSNGVNQEGFQQANAAFHPIEDLVYFSRCEDGRCDIWQAEIINEKWENQEKVDQLNLPGYSTTMPHVAQIGKDIILFCASDRNGTEGKMDIWWSQWTRDGFSRPINAGPQVNSPDNEISPFYFNNALYFSSEWHVGFGGFDLFRSEGAPRSFKKPENLGYPFNTNANDMYWAYYPNLKMGFLSSNRQGSYVEEGEICCNDLYSFQYKDSIQTELTPYESLEELNDYLPVTLYFHNDEPDPRTLDTTTTIRYDEAYDSYKKLVPTYLKEAEKGLRGDEAEEAVFEMEEFFSFYVDKGMEDLRLFTKLLLKELEKGTDVELSVKGFASPRAKSDYNLNLTKRRIASMENYLRHYDNGVFEPYFSNSDSLDGSLSIVQIPFGEYKADQTVSDELDDEKESIYSKKACLERKIEIRSVQRAPQDTLIREISLSNYTHDFGAIIESEGALETVFDLINDSAEQIRIEKIESPCGCTVAEPESDEVLPNESIEIKVNFDPKGKSGIQAKTIQIFIEGQEEPLEFTITGEVKSE